MNERIQELAEQSLPNVKFWNEEITKGNTPPNSRAITLDELEKFAELIVRECRKVIIDDMDSNPDDEAFNDALDHAQSIIGEHFGLEE